MLIIHWNSGPSGAHPSNHTIGTADESALKIHIPVVPSTTHLHYESLQQSRCQHSLRPLTPDASRQLDVLRHNCHALRVNRAQVGVLEQTNKVSLRRLLQRQNSTRLETEVGLEVLGNFSDKALEGKLPDEQVS